jgi:putative membrane protein
MAPAATGDSVRPSGGAPSPAGILSQLYIANTSEIQLSKLAARKASSPKVKQVANKLAADHARNREEERALAQRLNVTLTPAAGGDLAAADSAVLPPKLQGKTGPDFDQSFVEHEIKEHEAGIEKIRTELLPAAQNAEVQAYLQKTLATMQGHLTDLRQVQRQPG